MTRPRSWSVVEKYKWDSWKALKTTPPAEAMRLFVKQLEQEDVSGGWGRGALGA